MILTTRAFRDNSNNIQWTDPATGERKVLTGVPDSNFVMQCMSDRLYFVSVPPKPKPNNDTN